ncbi:hypothetical protein OC861_002735 [Tilletia horrida]|nr:hypothetical protein OC861_002735 [Tilletia horrida]
MSPALPHSSVFTRLYGDNVLDVSALLLNVSSSNEMQLELFNLLINPLHHAFALGWHRDDVKPDISPEDEKALMVGSHDPNSTASATKDGGGIQWNAALYDDACLFVVPGTHRRIRTEEERRANALPPPPPTVIPEGSALSEKEKQALDGSWDGVDPPTTQRVFLKAGQTAFYSQRILHRASYLPTQIRATLHGCYGVCIAPVAPPPAASSTALQDTTNATADLGTSGATAAAAAATAATIVSEQRARNVLQHGVEWMKDPAFGACLPDRLRPMWDNLLRMERQWAGKELGFSLDN